MLSYYPSTLDLNPIHYVICYYLLLARLIAQYCFAGWRLSSSSVTLPGAWMVGSPEAGPMGGWAANTARRASVVTSR